MGAERDTAGERFERQGKPANRACLYWGEPMSGLQRSASVGELSVLQHQGHLGDFLLQQITFFAKLTQLIATDGNIQSLWNTCR